MRQAFLYARNMDSLLKYAPEACARTKTLSRVCVVLGKKRYAPKFALNLKLLWPAWGNLHLKLDMRQVCASHIPRWSSCSSWNTVRIPPLGVHCAPKFLCIHCAGSWLKVNLR